MATQASSQQAKECWAEELYGITSDHIYLSQSESKITSMSNRYEDINCVFGGGDLMKVEYYIQFCSHWVRLYLDVWCFEDWDEDWAKNYFQKADLFS